MTSRHPNGSIWHEELREYLKASGGSDDSEEEFKRFPFVEQAESWGDFVAWLKPLLEKRWAFRGQRKSEWTIAPSIDRVLYVTGKAPGVEFGTNLEREPYEDRMLFQFRQEAHQHRQNLPDDCDRTSWLAMMQHHGVPTRLLDWTWSPYVAAYFAIEEASEKAAIWAIDLDRLEHQGNRILDRANRQVMPTDLRLRAEYLNGLLSASAKGEAPKMIVRVEPRMTDAWMTSQRGLFLCKSWDGTTLNKLLMFMMSQPSLGSEPRLRKLDIDGSDRFKFLRQLKAANVHHGSLFPGLDGLSKSLKVDLQMEVEQRRQELEEVRADRKYFAESEER